VTKPPVLEVKKNTREVVRVQPTTYNGIDLVDARVWTVPVTPDGESKPTKKGLTLQPATWTEVLRAVQVLLGTGSDADPEDGVLGEDDDPFGGDV
jgi:hypothetical protein